MSIANNLFPALMRSYFMSVSNKVIIREIVKIINVDCSKVEAKGLHYGDSKKAKRACVRYVFDAMKRNVTIK
jgi:hypothetical protein